MLDTVYKKKIKFEGKDIFLELVYGNSVGDICIEPDNETFIFHTEKDGVAISGLQGECIAANDGTAYMKATVRQEKISDKEADMLLSVMNLEGEKLLQNGLIKEFVSFV